MGLETINGQLCITEEEFGLYAYKEINRMAVNQPYVVATSQAEDEIGYRRDKSGPNVWPEMYLVESVRKRVVSVAYSWGYTQAVGEMDLNGRTLVSIVDAERFIDRAYTYDDGTVTHGNDMADIGPIGPSSIVGMIALELCRRLERELLADQEAEMRYRRWEPPHDPPPAD